MSEGKKISHGAAFRILKRSQWEPVEWAKNAVLTRNKEVTDEVLQSAMLPHITDSMNGMELQTVMHSMATSPNGNDLESFMHNKPGDDTVIIGTENLQYLHDNGIPLPQKVLQAITLQPSAERGKVAG